MKLHSKINTAIIAVALSFNLISMPLAFADVKKDTSQRTTVSDTKLKPKTEKDKKNEASHVFWKFLQSMLWVAGSCGAIYIVLLAYKRFKKTNFVNPRDIQIEKNLNSPETVEEATRFVIEKF